MTPEQRAAARARCAVATREPWDVIDSRVETWAFVAPNGKKCWPEGGMAFQVLGGQGPERSSDFGWSIMAGTAGPHTIPPRREDLLFAAHARTDLPLALDALDAADGLATRQAAEIRRLDAEVARLRKGLEATQECLNGAIVFGRGDGSVSGCRVRMAMDVIDGYLRGILGDETAEGATT